MYSPLPPAVGDPPPKVVFTNVGDAATARQLYATLLGAIGRFQAKARQAHALAEQPGSGMQANLPGVQLRYTYNFGQETIYVTITVAPEQPTSEPGQDKPKPYDVVLAIDVLFDPAQFVVGDIYSRKPYTITHPGGDPMYPNDPQYYSPGPYELIYSQPVDHTYINSQWVSNNPDNVAARNPITSGYFETPQSVTTNRFMPSAKGGVYSDLTASQHIQHDFAVDPNDPTPPATYKYTVVAYGGLYDNTATTFNGSKNAPYSAYCVIDAYESSLVYTGPLTPPTTETGYHNYRERRTYLDILPVVGLRVVPASDKPYAALSTGDYDDGRLRALVDGEKTAVQRQIAFADPAGGDGFYGAGFLAKPLQPITPGTPPDKVKIEVYIASSNVTQKNSPPGQEGSAFGTDEPDMTYDVTPDLTASVQVRELSDGTSFVVRAAVDAEGKVEEFGPDDVNTVTSTSMDQAARHLDWRFAAQSNAWRDSGGPPAAPDGPGMGKLLASQDAQSFSVAAVDVSDRKVFTEPTWVDDVTNMRMIATIEWTPPAAPGLHGTAKITPA